MPLRRSLLLGLALWSAVATSAPEDAPPVTPPPTPMEQPIETRVAQLVDAITAQPERADELLQRAGMTEAELEAHLYAIARDPGRTAAYEQARER